MLVSQLPLPCFIVAAAVLCIVSESPQGSPLGHRVFNTYLAESLESIFLTWVSRSSPNNVMICLPSIQSILNCNQRLKRQEL